KIVVPTGNPGEYTVTLEVYVTGEKVTQTITEDIATDIILVLDQSGSMANNDFKTITGYQVASGTASSFEDTDLYVKVGEEEYVEVTVTTDSVTTYAYDRYKRSSRNENRTNEQIYEYVEEDKLYYQVGSDYWPITVKKDGNQYTYSYIDGTGATQLITTSNGDNTRLDYNSYAFYTRRESTSTPTSYTYSYKDANGVTQSESFASNANITTNKYYTATTSTITRLQALKNAVTAFAESVHEKAKGKDGKLGTDDDVNHRVAIVGFANYSNYDDYNNSEVFVGGTGYKYGSDAQGQYDKALQDMNTTDGYNNIIASKNALSADGATYVDLGIEMANGILEKNPVASGEKRNRVVIVFTDGDPGYTGKWEGGNYGSANGNAEAVADKAITNATTSKTTYGATVYTIGVFNGADAETRPVSSVSNGNRFMHYVSSNYSGGTSFDSPGTESFPSSGSYYLSANNTTDLTGIFKQISQNVEGGGATTELDEETVVRDIVAPNFTVPAGTTDIKFYTQAYTGEDTWGERVDAIGVSASQNTDGTTTTLDITGFDFSANYVGKEIKDNQVTGYRGKKLVIEFKINEDPDFLGGSNVDTNGSLSGIYSDGQLLEQFEQPKVNVGLKEISTIVQDKYIYYGNTTDLTGLLNLYVKRNDQQTDLRVTVDGINNAYVHLQYTIKLDDNTVAVYTILPGMPWAAGEWSTQNEALLRDYLAKDDTKFSITCVMTDAATPTNTSTANGSATVFVYKPTITFKDSVQEYKKSLKIDSTTYTDIDAFLNAHFVKTEWKHGEDTVTPEGVEPEITYEFTYANMGSEKNPFVNYQMNATSDVPVDVIAKISGNTTPLVGNDGVTFAHQACGKDVTCNYPKGNEEFIVHVINAITQLTIEKEGWNTVDPNQTFLFTVTGSDAEGQQINLTVTVHENGSVTIDGLIIGNEYTITEKTDWSWRYDFDSWSVSDSITTTDIKTENGAEIKLGETGNVITFTNSRINEYWLDGDSWCDNRFMSIASPAIN
ncbi:MAG: VWA domain-containing protein, partial [Clostridia bacterium]|nr:VWA domain-containing protein [Clostridia bacterium]